MALHARRSVWCSCLLAAGFLGAGCSPVDYVKGVVEKQAMDSLANKAVSGVTGGRVGVETGNGQVVLTDKGSGTSYSLGENVTIPKDFPPEMLVYPNAKVLAVTSGKEQNLSLKAGEFEDTVAIWYADKLVAGGWKEASKLAAGGYEGRSYTKGDVTLSFTYLGSRESGSKSTVINITRKQGN